MKYLIPSIFLMLINLPALAIAKNSKVGVIPTTSQPIEFKGELGFSFSYNNCYDLVVGPEDDSDDIKTAKDLSIVPTSQCPKTEQGNGIMGFQIFKEANYSNEKYFKNRTATFPKSSEQKIKVGNYDAILFSGVKSEANKLIDEKDQHNYLWAFKVICKKVNIAVFYLDHIDKQQREKARTKPEPPAAFKALLDSFKCE